MLENMTNLLIKAKEKQVAIPQFNINNLEWTRFILEQAAIDKSPVILGVSEGASNYMGGFKVVVSLVTSLMEELKINIPVVIHLDHGTSYEACEKAIKAGFTSVMIDGSKLAYEENVKLTTLVSQLAQINNVSVEAELGHIGGTEEQIVGENLYARPEECQDFVRRVAISALAPALGSVHGLYKGEPKIAFDLMKEISIKTNSPLVLHGGTGLSDEIISQSILCGTCKINFNTELQIEWTKAVRIFLNENKDIYDPRKIIKSGEQAIKNVVHQKIILLKSNQI